jgi:iron complex outermembrane receptor protein
VSYELNRLYDASALGGLTFGAGVRYVGGSDGTTTYAVANGASTFTSFTTDSFVLVDAMASYDVGRALPSLQGFEVAINAANLFDERHVTACPFSNSCYFGAARTVIGTLRYEF